MTIEDGIKLGFGLCAGKYLWDTVGEFIDYGIAVFVIETDFVDKDSRLRKSAESLIEERYPRTYSQCVERGRIHVVEQKTRRKIGF